MNTIGGGKLRGGNGQRFRIDTRAVIAKVANMKIAVLFLLASVCIAGAAVEEESVVHAGTTFRIMKLDAKRVSVVWKDKQGKPYRSFDKVQAEFEKTAKKVSFLMNAGIFEPGGIPSGLHVEERKILHPLNLADAPGNFFLKPNGVVWIEAGGNREAFISTPQTFATREKERHVMSSRWLEWAVQSGPLLLIDGKRHPAFTENSKSKLPRNGVGVDGEKRLVFAITGKGQVVNFWDFSGLFLKLGCKDALFLDGDLSQMTVNPTGPVRCNQFGAMFVIAE
jgi:uncharacterized protein YigE (DUF2233 family)